MKPVKSIAFAGILAALHVGAMLLSMYPATAGFQFIILFLMPFCSAYYSYKAEAKYSLIYFVATMLICSLVGLASADPFGWFNAFLYVLPTLVAGLLFGFLVKKNQGGMTIVYVLTIAEFVLICLGCLIAKSFVEGSEFVDQIENYFTLSGSGKTLAMGLIIAYCFAQSYLVYVATKYELKRLKVEVKKDKYPPLWLFMLAVISMICCFIPFKKELYVFFAAVSVIVFGLPIALYGYQSCQKVWILLAIQAVCFLAGTLPLMQFVYTEEGFTRIVPYLIVALPPIVYAFISLVKQEHNKPENYI